MAKVNKDKPSFFDQPLEDPDGELREACEEFDRTHQAALDHQAANEAIKKILAKPDKPTRFVVGEDLFIEVNPTTVKMRERRGTSEHAVLRKKIKWAHEGEAD